MTGALLTLFVFTLFPADGPFRKYPLQPNDAQHRYLQQLDGLRAGNIRTVGWHAAEGLITFPSFHTTWALLLALSLIRRKRLFVPFAVLNFCVVISTMTTGWHYLSDVIGGLAVCALAAAFSRRVHAMPVEPAGHTGE